MIFYWTKIEIGEYIFLYSYDAFRIVCVTGVKVVVIVAKVLLSKGLNIQMGNKSTQEKAIRFRSSGIGGSAMDNVFTTKSMGLRQPISDLGLIKLTLFL